uniref:PTM/DIR17-like Tudor domain-containing protein n=1 Tax=Oryza meridionalis TaxID=40149 RepID=A0A0E0C9Z1_9ORYZ
MEPAQNTLWASRNRSKPTWAERLQPNTYHLNPLPIFPVGCAVQSPTSRRDCLRRSPLAASASPATAATARPPPVGAVPPSPATTCAGAPSVLRGCCQIQAVRIYPPPLTSEEPSEFREHSSPQGEGKPEVMEEIHGMQESKTASVVKVAREPAIIINGVPDLPPDVASESQPEPRKVDKYDSESNWYSVVYQDGDQEDLEWKEVEEIMLPLDITTPLKTLISDKFALQNTVPVFKPKVGRPRKVYAMTDGNTNNAMEDQMMTGAANVHQSNNLLALVPASTSNDAYVNASSQPRKRGRPRKDATMYPRKDATIPANTQPKRRGRPPKNRNLSGNAQSAECTPQNSVLVRNAQTVRAEKLAKAERLKRENMHVQGAPPGTQFF